MPPRGIVIDRTIKPQHRMAVLLPFGGEGRKKPSGGFLTGLHTVRISPKLLFGAIILGGCSLTIGEALAGPGEKSLLATILDWSPFLLKGFGFNLLISFMSMLIGTLAGSVLGIMQISQLNPIRKFSWYFTQFFRNSPWLVLLFYAMFMIPFELKLGGLRVPFPDWIKAVIGLSLPVMANVSEIVRGAVNSIPSGQWEAAESLAFSRQQQIWQIIMPQCYKRMLPPWMNLYSILTMATVLASIVGVEEVMTGAGQVLAADGRSELLIPLYSFVLVWFFAYCFPISRLTIYLERKFAVNI